MLPERVILLTSRSSLTPRILICCILYPSYIATFYSPLIYCFQASRNLSFNSKLLKSTPSNAPAAVALAKSPAPPTPAPIIPPIAAPPIAVL